LQVFWSLGLLLKSSHVRETHKKAARDALGRMSFELGIRQAAMLLQ
jgi:hypothetical protein